jgi:hypothetical protein
MLSFVFLSPLCFSAELILKSDQPKKHSPNFIGPLVPFDGPGGIDTNLVTWLKANTIVGSDDSDVSTWNDASGANDFSSVTADAPPKFRDDDAININFNPIVRFTSSVNRLEIANNADFNDKGSDPINYFLNKRIHLVFRTPSAISDGDIQVIYEQGGGTRGLNFYLEGNASDIPILKVSAWNRNEAAQFGGWNPDAVALSENLEVDKVYLVTFELEGSTSDPLNGEIRAYIKGQEIGTGIPNIGALYNHGGGIKLGGSDGTRTDSGSRGNTNTDPFSGDIAEFVYYNEPSLNQSDRNLIESYLALKYGITLSQNPSQTNYVNSSGTVIFNTNLNTASGGFEDYDTNIAGIGRDNGASGSNLLQLKSRSIEDGSIVTIEASAISSDQSFLIWGNDNGSNSFISNDQPNSISSRLSKIWRVSETGTDLGGVSVSFDLSVPFDVNNLPTANDLTLLVAGDNSGADFSNATILSGGVINNSTITFSNVNLSNAEYFTLGFGSASPKPGGVGGDLQLWLKADFGTNSSIDGTDITSWQDASGNSNNASATAAPQYNTNQTNFNPSLDFTAGNSDVMTIPDAAGNNDSPDEQALFVVGSISAASEDYAPFIIKAATYAWDDGWGLAKVNNLEELYYHKDNWTTNSNGDDLPDQDIEYDRTYLHVAFTDPSADTYSYNLNLGAADTRASSAYAPSDNFTFIGASPDSDGATGNVSTTEAYLQGSISEIIMYSSDLDDGTPQDVRISKITSYLAVKYGITLDQSTATNYIDSNGDEIWNATTNASYNNDIAAIGRDDASGLEQKQSKSINDNTVLTIGNVSIAATNTLNANSFASDRIWLSWGNDGNSTSQANAIVSNLPSTVNERMARIWKVEKSGAVDNVTLSFDLATLGYGNDESEYTLLIDDDNNFSNATILSGATFNGTVLSFSNINLDDGATFTLGTERTLAIGPGGELANLTTWLKANDASNVTTSTDGASVTLWEDALSGSYNFSTGTSAPTYNDNEGESMNFNQNIEFDAAGSSSLTTANNNDYNETTSFFVRKEVQMAFRTSSDITTRQVLYEQGGSVRGINIYIRDGQLHISAWNRFEDAPLGDWNNSGDVNSVSTSIATNQSYIVTFQMDGDDNSDGNGTANGTVTLYLNGNSIGSLTGIGVLYEHVGLIGLGYSENDTYFDDGAFTGTGEYFTGQIAEFIYRNEPPSFSSSQRNQTESYLAVKYGVTLDQTTATDYSNSSGTIIWDAASNSAYNNDIAGIGRDDKSAFIQPKSKSANQDAIVTIETNTAISTDDSWLIWSNDGQSIEGTNSEGNTELPPDGSIESRLFREWYIQKNGSGIGTVQVTFDLSGLSLLENNDTYTKLRLLVDSDGNFSSGADSFSPISVNTITKEAVFEVDFEDADFFTLGSTEAYVLPIELISFEVFNEENQVVLTWITASESNNSFFTIERSTDGLNYEALGYLDGAGNSTSQKVYQFMDQRPSRGLNYYRVKQTDFNGQFSYTDIKSVFYEQSTATKFYPNPVEPGHKVHIQSSLINGDSVKVWITNPQGQKENLSIEMIANDHIEVLIPSLLKRGMYLLQLFNQNGETEIMKVLIN